MSIAPELLLALETLSFSSDSARAKNALIRTVINSFFLLPKNCFHVIMTFWLFFWFLQMLWLQPSLCCLPGQRGVCQVSDDDYWMSDDVGYFMMMHIDVLYMPMPMTSGWSCQWWSTMVLKVVVVLIMLYKNIIMRQWLSGKHPQADLVQGGRRQLYLWPRLHSPAHGDNFYQNWSHCVTRARLLLLRSWVAPYFKVRQSVNQFVRDL